MHDPNLKLDICNKNFVVEETVSQIFDGGPGSFLKKIWKNKSLFLDIKQILRPKSEI